MLAVRFMNNHKIKIIVILLFLINFFYPHTIEPSPEQEDKQCIRVGIYADSGVGDTPGKESEYAGELEAIMKTIDPVSTTKLIKAQDIADDILKELDVVIFPGGSGLGQSKSLGVAGHKKVREFVEHGGGYIGICAGAYIGQCLDLNVPGYSLKLANAKIYNKGRYWDRGAALAKVRVSSIGTMLLPELKGKRFVFIHYNNGPLLVPGYYPHMKKYEEIMSFESSIYHNRPKAKGESRGKTFFLRGKKGKGMVVLMSGHPEATPGLRWLLPRMVAIAAQKKIISYDKRFINPFKYNREIMFNKRWKKDEAKYLTILKENSEYDQDQKVYALKILRVMASRDLCKNLTLLLSDKFPEVRKEAAKTIKELEYFIAVKDLKKALSDEKDPDVKKVMANAAEYLSVR